jgi:hypothetical protein
LGPSAGVTKTRESNPSSEGLGTLLPLVVGELEAEEVAVASVYETVVNLTGGVDLTAQVERW